MGVVACCGGAFRHQAGLVGDLAASVVLAAAAGGSVDTAFHPSAFAQWEPSRSGGFDAAPKASAPAASAASSIGLDHAPLTALLGEYLGPVAGVMVRRYVQRHADPSALVAALASELEIPAERAAFLARARKTMRLP